MLLNRPDAFRRLYPPRAIRAINPVQLPKVKGFIAQYKYNDIRTLLHILPGGEIELLTRRREPVKEYQLTSTMKRALGKLALDPEKYHLLDGGVLRHLRVRGERPIVLWDILVHDNNYLVGTTYRSRYALLKQICGDPKEYELVGGRKLGLKIARAPLGPLWLAPIFTEDLGGMFQSAIEPDYLEGLLLKAPGAKLEPGYREENNVSWQMKVRKPRTDYMY